MWQTHIKEVCHAERAARDLECDTPQVDEEQEQRAEADELIRRNRVPVAQALDPYWLVVL